MSVTAKWIARVLALVLLAVLAAALATAYRHGYRLGLYRTDPDPGEDTALRFGTAPDVDRLPGDSPPQARVRNVVLLVGDGMGFSQMAATRLAYLGPDGRLAMERFPVSSWVWTYAAGTLLTDSAAAATALASGFKTLPGALGVSPRGRPHPTLAEAALGRGLGVGLVTTTAIVDATPAAFASHVASRREITAVADQMAASGIELLIGEGADPGSPRELELMRALIGRFRERGYRSATTWEELQAAVGGGGRVLGMLPGGSIADPETAPALVDLFDLAVDRLEASPDGFFLLVESEEPDTGGHRGDLPRVAAGIWELDRVARRAAELARRRGDTLVLVTADHETGALVLPGGEAGEPLPHRWYSAGHTAAPVPLLAYGPGAGRFSGVLDNTEVPRILADLLGLDLFGKSDRPAPPHPQNGVE